MKQDVGFKKRLPALALMLAVVLFGMPWCLGQTAITGSIGGTITDSSSAVVSHAQVSITNVDTNSKTVVVTDTSGYYRATTLTPGRYDIEVAVPGFSLAKAEVVVGIGLVSEVNLTLQAGNATQSVTVTAQAPAINSDSPAFSGNFDQKAIANLPINGRHWTSFALMSPGVTLGDSKYGLVSIRGMSNLQNNFMVDGSDDNQAFQSVERGYTRVGYSTSQEAIQEFQVNTANYSAEYGRAAGGGVNAITKSGTNEFHGGAFWYDRDNQFGATNPYTTLNGVPIKPKDKRQQFGGSIGGPIIRDRLFFFYAYDQQVRLFPIVATPTSGFIASEAAQSTIAQSRGVNASDIAAAYSYLNQLSGLIPRTGNQDINFPKLDWKINDKNTASLMYNRMRWSSPGGIQTNPVIQRGITASGNDYVNIDSIIGNLNTTIKSNLINTVRYEYARDYEFETNQTPAPIEPTTGPGGLPPETYINTQGGFFIGTPDYLPRSKYPNEHENQVVDNLMWVRGNHTISTGFDFRRVYDDIAFLNPAEGEFTYSGSNALADFVTDYANYKFGNGIQCDTARDGSRGALPCYATIQQAFGTPEFQMSTNEYATYLQDSWKFNRRLNLNFGLRYELDQMPSAQFPNAAIPQTSSFPTSKASFGPRFGFAYDITGKGSTVVRGGYGIYYGRTQNGTIFSALTNTGNSKGQFNFLLNNTSAGAPVYPNVLSSGTFPSSGLNIKVFDPDFKTPFIQEADLIVQQALPWKAVLTTSYLLSIGRHLPNFIDYNIAPATKSVSYNIVGGPLNGTTYTLPFYTARLNPAFGQITHIVSNINSNYNALVFQLDRQFDHGLSFQSSFTWSKALDQGMNETQGADGNDPFDPFNQSLDYGKSLDNIPLRFVVDLVWNPSISLSNRFANAVANGWTLSPIATLQSGLAYSYVVSGGANGGISSSLNGSNGGNYLNTLGRNSAKQPAIDDVDLRIARDFGIYDRLKLNLFAESFNILNRQNITSVNTTAYTASGTTLNYQSTFGVPTAAGNTVYRERQLQFGARLTF